ncbi:MAG: glycosyl hydrolase [Bacteroidia bacterium]|nr:glycosyl hydrolase [Bacteroidia bacterium]
MKRLSTFCSILFIILSMQAQEAQQYFKPLKYRNIGPFRGGRSVSASGVIGDQLTYYMGTTGGGLWKTEDAGQRWNNISDGFFKTGSVGAVAVSESNPNIVFVGMGEHAVRGVMTSYGDGVYKSTDAGKTWTHMGLKETQQISRIVIHPTNPDIILVAAQGALHGPTKERGIYKSTDGGKTWKKVLYVNDMTGGVELSMDMNYPEVIYAAMSHHQRKPWVVISGGEGSGLYKSTDGGETWKKIHKGLPKELGKMAIAVCRSNSNKVYALIESDSNKDLGGLFVSNNAGASWSRVSDDNRLTQRAWYYIEVFPDPNDENTVYVLSAPALRSIDGGKTWERITGTHGDYHDLWINPNNSKNMVIANDGGAAISFNQGKSWSTQNNMSTAQIYRINTDNLFPYNIYGGQQDNTSVKIASLSTGRWSIGREDWTYSAGGESAFLAFDPDNPRYVMGGVYLGYIEVKDMQSKSGTNIMAKPNQWLGREARDMEYLFNWNAPIIWSKHEPGTFYHCANKVLKTTDMGKSWTEFSPDLTRDIDEKQGNGGAPYTNEAVGAENYGTIAYIIESPQEAGVFWTGSDDGLVHVTRDNGKTWQNVTPKGLQECLVNAIDLSPHDPGTAYIATTRYKFNDYKPGLYKTSDYGKSWKKIDNGIPNGAYTRVVREDQDKKGLLYAGTETGIYISWNDGQNWEPFQLNLPVTPITDLKVHKGDLVVATSGRGFWVLDDLGLLNQQRETSKLKLYTPEETINGFWGSQLSINNPSFDGTNSFEGVNPANGLVIYYNLPKLEKDQDVTLEIKNSTGKLVNTISSKRNKNYRRWDGGPPPEPALSKGEGLNRFVWNMGSPVMSGIPDVYIEANYRGHRIGPGTYTLTLKAGDDSETVTAVIKENPQYETKPGQYDEYDAFMSEMEATLTDMHNKVNSLYKAKKQIQGVIKTLEAKGKSDLAAECKTLVDELTKWDEDMVQRKSKAYDDVENFPNKFSAEYIFLINQSESSIPRVNDQNRSRKTELDAQWNGLKQQAAKFMEQSIPNMNKKLWEAGIGAIIME